MCESENHKLQVEKLRHFSAGRTVKICGFHLGNHNNTTHCSKSASLMLLWFSIQMGK